MKNVGIFGCLPVVLYNLVYFFAIYSLVHDYIEVPILGSIASFLITIVLANIPIVGTILAVMGAVDNFGWPLFLAIIIMALPFILSISLMPFAFRK